MSRNPGGGLATLRTGSSSAYYLLDDNGNVTGLITSTGTLPTANTYTYEPYGNLTTATPTGIAATNPFRYNSGLETADGLYHYGARYYNPTNGRWTQQDPSGQNPGYVYGGDNPINNRDPTGYGFWGDVSSGLSSVAAAASTVYSVASTASAASGLADFGVSLDSSDLILAAGALGPAAVGVLGAGVLRYVAYEAVQ